MKTSLSVETGAKAWIGNITEQVQEAVAGVDSGLVHISIPHTTAAIFLAEDDDELREDYIKVATESLADQRPFKHIRKNNPNTEAHVFSSLFGATLTLVMDEGKLQLGTYQNIMLLEMDGPKTRTVHITAF